MAQKKKLKSVALKEDVYNRLICYGSFSDSLSDVVNHVIDLAEARKLE